MLSCREATRLMSEAQERSLSWRERVALMFHAAMCSGCRNARKQFALLRRAIRLYRSTDRPNVPGAE